MYGSQETAAFCELAANTKGLISVVIEEEDGSANSTLKGLLADQL